jgi:magnesium-protoporphyrin IX monomethyl ester (oxidative) cyclase
MKVLLIQPPSTLMPIERPHVVVPLGTAYIAAVLEKNHEVEVLDCVALGWSSYLSEWKGKEIKSDEPIHFGLSWGEIEDKIRKTSPDLVGISNSYSCQADNAYKTAEIVKKINPETLVVFGGAHPTSYPSKVLEEKNIDIVIIGEGEETIRELCEKIESGESYADVKGIAFMEGREIKINPRREFIQNIDSIPLPARHLLPMDEYFAANSTHGGGDKWTPVTSMITSRGCPGICVFCSIHGIWGNAWRARTPKNVVDEIEQLVNKYGVKEIHFEDDNLTLNKKRMIEICDEIKSRGLNGKFRWTTPNSVMVATLDEEVIIKMKESGCYSLSFGIESGSKRILKEVIRKNVPFDRLREIIKTCKKLDIETAGSFIIGLPGETKETFRQTIDFAKSLDLDKASFLAATPFPGTKLYDICKEKGYIPEDLNWSDLRTIGSAVISTEEFSKEDVLEWQKRGYREFYSSPKRMVKTLLQNIKSPSKTKRLLSRYRKFVK